MQLRCRMQLMVQQKAESGRSTDCSLARCLLAPEQWHLLFEESDTKRRRASHVNATNAAILLPDKGIWLGEAKHTCKADIIDPTMQVLYIKGMSFTCTGKKGHKSSTWRELNGLWDVREGHSKSVCCSPSSDVRPCSIVLLQEMLCGSVVKVLMPEEY